MSALPRLAYQLYFQQKTDEAIAEMNKDIRRTLRATLRSVTSAPPEKYLTSKDSYLFGWETYKTASASNSFQREVVNGV